MAITQNIVQRTDLRGYKDNAPTGKATAKAVDATLPRMPKKPDETVAFVSNKGHV